MEEFKNILDKINQSFRDSQSDSTTGKFGALSMAMQEAEDAMREHMQLTTKEQMIEVAEKLKSGAPLTAEDIDYIKLWIVGDAEYYVKMENNYHDWVQELDRVIKEINVQFVDQPDFHISSKLRALLLDGIRVIGDILFYVKQKERIENFEESTEEIDEEERKLLLQILEGKARSSRY